MLDSHSITLFHSQDVWLLPFYYAVKCIQDLQRQLRLILEDEKLSFCIKWWVPEYKDDGPVEGQS